MDEEEREEKALAVLPEVFEGRRIRRVFRDKAWWFAVEDVAAALAGGPDPGGAWDRLKEQEMAVCGVDLSELCRWLEMELVTSGHGSRMEAVTLEGIFRIVQSISSPRAEVFKRWLARVATEPADQSGYRTDLDTVFALLEDAATATITSRQGGEEGVRCRLAANKGRRIVGEARERLEI